MDSIRPIAELCAKAARGFFCIYNGLPTYIRTKQECIS